MSNKVIEFDPEVFPALGFTFTYIDLSPHIAMEIKKKFPTDLKEFTPPDTPEEFTDEHLGHLEEFFQEFGIGDMDLLDDAAPPKTVYDLLEGLPIELDEDVAPDSPPKRRRKKKIRRNYPTRRNRRR